MNLNLENVYLENETAKKLYEIAKDLPIFDYHCHLSPKEIYYDKDFDNITKLWLHGDHYKWRVMRAYGIEERYVTGDATDKEKFFAFCRCMPSFIGNPVYQWASLELKTYFDIDLPLNEENAEEIWEKTLQKMSGGEFSARKLLERSKVETVITTDDPVDDLEYHDKLKDFGVKVLPSLRIDKVLQINDGGYASYVKKLEEVSGVNIKNLDNLLTALTIRLDYFVSKGAVAVDMSFNDFPINYFGKEGAIMAFDNAVLGNTLSKEDIESYQFYLITTLAKELNKRGVVMQMHSGVIRNLNERLYSWLGADVGCDASGDTVSVVGLYKLLSEVAKTDELPKTIVYTLNQNASYAIATVLGAFNGKTRGRVQLGAAWWFADNYYGIKEQLKVIATQGGLGLFNGMLTDSRSFTSYARHDYFRRILCSQIGEFVERGEYPSDERELNKLICNICYENAKNYFRRDI
ncbi:MAG: glucuronate isomerase [Eubacteriales bacterium]|nr:glucuronate isomerase [Eubacteriales bacterium]